VSAKHTGGTWRAAAKPSSIVGWPIISAPQGKSVANVHGTDEESAANARLIAAAPDLLEALKKLSFAAQTSGGTAGRDEALVAAIDHASAIIAKAQGSAP
jgi:hypothetical protein